jgi:hypothetical protein
MGKTMFCLNKKPHKPMNKQELCQTTSVTSRLISLFSARQSFPRPPSNQSESIKLHHLHALKTVAPKTVRLQAGRHE